MRRPSFMFITAALCFIGCRPQPLSPTPSTPDWFTDITRSSGLDFVHNPGADGRFLMPEIMGSGTAFIDLNNDGRLDIYLIQNAGPDSAFPNQLYQQQTDGTFKNVSKGSGLDVTGFGMGAAAGDVNNDGWTDVLLTEYGAVRLFVNQGTGTFTEIRNAGLDNPRWSTSAAFLDYDRDGWLDVIVANYVDADPSQHCYDAVGRLDYCGPRNAPPLVSRLYRNRGTPENTRRFTDVTVASGLAQKRGPALGVVCADANGDRWPDILIADDGEPNRLYLNQQDGTFREEAVQRGIGYNALGQPEANMGIGLGDVDGDGLFDIFITHLMQENHTLWKQGPRGLFRDATSSAGLIVPDRRGTGFGTALADFSNNGWLDVVLVNGRVRRGQPDQPTTANREQDARETSPVDWSEYAQRDRLFANQGEGRFRDVSAGNPSFSQRVETSRGLALGDVDNDGAIDILVTSIASPARLFRNTAPTRGHWLIIRAIDPALGGRDALGAEVLVTSGDRTWWRLVHAGGSYLSSNDPRVHFGLGSASKTDSIRVLWPDGLTEAFPGGAVDRLLTLSRGTGQRVTALSP